MRLVSFDIFDTTLLRICGAPENVFYMLSQRLFGTDADKRDIFLLWRLNAEAKAVALNGSSTSIDDIYNDTDLVGLTEKSIPELVGLELALEKEVLRPYPEVVKLIKQYRKNGYDIAFISDMYLPSDYLKEILKNYGLFADKDWLFVSNEWSARKSDGSLYRKVREKLHPDQWIHYGDNRHSDVKMAKKQGINARKVDTSFSVTEMNLLSTTKTLLCNYDASILAGITRYARLTSNNSMEVFASLFVAPIYIPYIYYIKDKVLERKCKQMYFLSRDAYILMKGFDKIKETYMETHYFFVSRKSLILPFYFISTKDSFLEAFSKRTIIGKSLSDICNSLKIERKELFESLPACIADKIKNKEQERAILDCFFDSPLATKIREKAKLEYDTFVAYLRQEGLLDTDNSIWVDLGWIGTSRLMINKILDSINAKRVHFIYYSTNKGVLPYKYGTYSTFWPYDGETVAYFEQYFSECPYPSTIGYTHKSGKVCPVFASPNQYKETEVLKANCVVLNKVMDLLLGCHFQSNEALKYWALTSRNSLVNCKENTDYRVLSRKEIDKHESAIARKFTKLEMVRFLFGIHIEVNRELPSAIITFGFNFTHFYLPINKRLKKYIAKLKEITKKI